MSIAGKIGLGFHPTDTAQGLDIITRAEAAGVGTAWTVMSPLDRDTVTMLAAAAMRTNRIKLGTAVVPAFTRHPLGLATQVLVLEDLAPGRIRLGIGTSHERTMVPAYGLPFDRPLSQLREYLQILHPLLQTGSVTFSGDFYRVDATFRVATETPVLISALREHAFELAGAMADGAISWLCPPTYLSDVALPAMRRGAEQTGREAPPLIAHVLVAPSEEQDRVRAAAREVLAYYEIRPFYRRMFAAAGFPLADGETIPDALIDALVISGSDDAIAEGLLQRLGLGADELVVGVVPGDDLRAAEDGVLRVVAGL